MSRYCVEIAAEAFADIERQMAVGYYSPSDFLTHDLPLARQVLADRFDELPQIGPGLRELTVGTDAAITCPYYRVFAMRSLDDIFGLVVLGIDIGSQTVDPS